MMENLLADYDRNNLTIGVLGGHSALDVCAGAKKLGFRTVVVAQKGRDLTFSKYYKSRDDGRGCVDEVILVDKFADIVQPEVQERLRKLNTIFIHNRYFWVYCNFEEIERDFKVPIFGLREAVKLEERDHPNNQYVLLTKAGIRIPKIVREGGEVLDNQTLKKRLEEHFSAYPSPLIIKVSEAQRSYERAFFVINSAEAYFENGEKMVAEGRVLAKELERAVIEEYIVGAHINLNFFYSPLSNELELMGTDTRRQTNLDGFLRLNAEEQINLLAGGFKPNMVETGHYAVTMKESLVEKAYEIGERFLEIMKKEMAPGMIGPFALQGAVVSENGKEEFVIFDVSMRIPGSPGTKFTPYSGYLFGESMSYGERIAMEIAAAAKADQLEKIVT